MTKQKLASTTRSIPVQITFLLKLFLVPLLIGMVTLAGRWWGPKIAGWLSAFPIVAGPILYFIALDQGNNFAVTAATGTLSGVIAIIIFGATYAWSALKFNWIGSLSLALLCYSLTVLALQASSISLYLAAGVSLLATIVAPRFYPTIAHPSTIAKPSRFDLPLRMIMGAILVFLITYFAAHLGPRLSGILAMFPFMSIILTVFSHRNAGKEFAIILLKGMLFGWYAFSTFCFALAVLLPHTSINTAFLIATIAALIVQLGSRRLVY